MDFNVETNEKGTITIRIPELEGKKVPEFRDYGNFWDVVDAPDYDPDEWESEEDFLMSAPTMNLEVIRDENGSFLHIELAIEEGEDSCRGGTDYVGLSQGEAQKVVSYVLRGLGLK